MKRATTYEVISKFCPTDTKNWKNNNPYSRQRTKSFRYRRQKKRSGQSAMSACSTSAAGGHDSLMGSFPVSDTSFQKQSTDFRASLMSNSRKSSRKLTHSWKTRTTKSVRSPQAVHGG